MSQVHLETGSASEQLPWTVHEIAYGSIDVARVRENRTLFYLVVSASFVESGSDLYAGNLAQKPPTG